MKKIYITPKVRSYNVTTQNVMVPASGPNVFQKGATDEDGVEVKEDDNTISIWDLY